MNPTVVLALLIGTLVLACSSAAPAPNATAIPEPTPIPTATALPEPTAVATSTPVPPPTLTPTPNAQMLEEARLDAEASDWFEQGASLFNREQYGEAIKAFDKAIEIAPKGSFYGWRGSSYMELGQYENAIQDITSAIQLEPTAIRYRNRGSSYAKLDQPQNAVDDYTKAIQLEPTATRGYINRAITYAELRQWDLYDQDSAIICSLDKQLC